MILLNIKITYDARMFHDFGPSSFGQAQGHLKENFIISFHNLCPVYLSYVGTLEVPSSY